MVILGVVRPYVDWKGCLRQYNVQPCWEKYFGGREETSRETHVHTTMT